MSDGHESTFHWLYFVKDINLFILTSLINKANTAPELKRINQLYVEFYKSKNIAKFRNTKISIERKVVA